MRRVLAHTAGLTAVWVLLWGSLTVANVATGALVSLALLAVFPLERRRRGTTIVLRPVAAVRLAAYFVTQLVASNVAVTWQVIRPRPALRTGIIACPLHTRSPGLITAITNMLALSPGTITVDVMTPEAPGNPTIFVHVLKLDDLDAARQQVARLERFVIDAFGSAVEMAACRAAEAVALASTTSRAGGERP
jgi:multicomponent Na+:H+ antiporter subunit E